MGLNKSRKLRIAVVVHGRFEAYFSFCALLNRGHDVTLYTNYPKWVLPRFNVNPAKSVTFLFHGILSRIARLLNLSKILEPFLCKLFGRWSRDKLLRKEWDAIYIFSGIAEETLISENLKETLKVLVRASSHIETQKEILVKEAERSGIKTETPSNWMVEREKREYELADKIRVLSDFCEQSFLDHGLQAEKIWMIPSAVPVRNSNATMDGRKERIQRLQKRQELNVLFVGTLCFRKGLIDLIDIIKNCKSREFSFRLVGHISREAKPYVGKLKELGAQLIGKAPEEELISHYDWADIFIFPSLEEGFPQVIAQAHASGLPVIATNHCGVSSIIEDGKNGWIVPIRRSDLFVKRLDWCLCNRKDLIEFQDKFSGASFKSRSWEEFAEELENKILTYEQSQSV